MSNTIYIGDVGTEIILDTGVDINAATVHSIDVKKPDGTIVEWPATIIDNTKLRYITLDGDIDMAGNWVLMAKVGMPSWAGHGDAVILPVRDLWV